MLDLLMPLVIGVTGSLHCLGMCGPLVLAYSLNLSDSGPPTSRAWRAGSLHHFAFHTGRLTSYGLLGATAALLVHGAGISPLLNSARLYLTFLAGLLLVAFGLVVLRLLPQPAFVSSLPATSSSPRKRASLLKSRSITSKYLLGFSAGFLPCMLSWAMLVKASVAQNPLQGFLTMVLFGAGTIPALFFTGLSASLLGLRLRLFGERMAGISILVMGAILIFKGAKHFV